MDERSYNLDPSLRGALAGLVGERWVCLGFTGRIRGDVLTCPVEISTDRTVIAVSVLDNEVALGGDDEVITLVTEVPLDGHLEEARRAGRIAVHGAGEVVRSVHLIREELVRIRDDVPMFRVSVDSGVVIELETVAIAIQKRGFHGFDFVLSVAPSAQQLRFHDSASEWPMNLELTCRYERVLIPCD